MLATRSVRCDPRRSPSRSRLVRLPSHFLGWVSMKLRCALGLLSCFGIAEDLPSQALVPMLPVQSELLISSETGDFSFIGSMLAVKGGVIVVTQPQDNGIRFYGPSGALLGKFGRAGSGPGEFRYVGSLSMIGDTIWIPDVNLRRATLVSQERKFLGTRPLPTTVVFRSPAAGQVTFIDPYPFAAYADGSVLFRGTTGRASAGLWPPPPREDN